MHAQLPVHALAAWKSQAAHLTSMCDASGLHALPARQLQQHCAALHPWQHVLQQCLTVSPHTMSLTSPPLLMHLRCGHTSWLMAAM
jgi:hypothetical protein